MQPVTRSWARNDGERVRSLWWKWEIAKCHWDSRWIFLGSIFFRRDTRTERKKICTCVYGSCSNVPEHSGLTHDCDQMWSIYIDPYVYLYLYIIYIHKNFEPDEDHWAGAGMAFRIYECSLIFHNIQLRLKMMILKTMRITANHHQPKLFGQDPATSLCGRQHPEEGKPPWRNGHHGCQQETCAVSMVLRML